MENRSSQTDKTVFRQHNAKAPKPVPPMNRHTKNDMQTEKNLLAGITREENLTEEQLKPLTAREKPKPAEAVFPSPAPAKKISPRESGATLRAAGKTCPTPPMPRHKITAQELQKKEWDYTPENNLMPATFVPQVDTKAEKPSDVNTVHAAVVKAPVNKKPIIVSAVAILLALVLILGAIFGIGALPKRSGKNPGGPTIVPPRSHAFESDILSPANAADFEKSFKYENAGTSAVGVSYKYIGEIDTADVVRPSGDEMKNESMVDQQYYPKYGSTPNGVLGTAGEALRGALIEEANYLTSTDTWNGGSKGEAAYNRMDAQGYLWNGNTPSLDSEGNQRKLYKHSASVGMYGGNVSDSEPRIIKQMTMRPRGYNSYSVTGLYAPAGELIKIEIDAKDMDATGGLSIHIGQALYNGKANNIWVAKNAMNRMAVILNTMLVNKNTATFNEETGKWEGYVGSFLGGPIYIRNTNVKFSATITGGVRYSHFILGYTTEAEFLENAKSSAPYFDLEVWHMGVLHSGPKQYAANFSYEDLYKVAVLWEKVAAVTTTGNNQGIVFLYDPFVAAGAAVAFPGQQSVNCPSGWMANSLNYNTIVTSGAWGNFHEYHHNFQGYGVGNGGEVTNNGLNLVSYALFTKISAARSITNFGADGLSGWNRYTSAPWALEQTLKIARENENPENGNQGLALYATLLHNFGADNYMQSKKAGGGQSYAAYMNAWQKVTHNNMYYYFNDILKGTGITNNADPSYPMFVPVSSVYQTGRSYIYDGQKRYFTTMRPYVINANEAFDIDLSPYKAPNGQYESGSVVIPEGFTYRIKSVSKPTNGTIELVQNNSYHLKYTPAQYSPDGNNYSGQIFVTLEITKKDGSFKVDDVDLVLEFETTNEKTKSVLQRTSYTYSADSMYTDAVSAYEAGFAGHSSIEQINHTNPTQNCNTDIWYYNISDRPKYPNAPDHFFFHDNTIETLEGKLHFAEAGTYRIFLRGRGSCAVYYSMGNDRNFVLGAKLNKGQYSDANFHPNDDSTYFDVTITEGMLTKTGYWVYIKEVLVVDASARSYIGLGTGQWTQSMFTISERYYNADGEAVDNTEAEDYQYTETTYRNIAGNEVAVVVDDKDSGTAYFKIEGGKRVESTLQEVSELTKTQLIPPTSAAYVNAYNKNYEFSTNNDFETDFFYVRTYNLNYSNNVMYGGQTLVSTKNYEPRNNNPWLAEYIVDGDKETSLRTNNGRPSEEYPLELVVDLGEVRTVNRTIIYSQSRSDLQVSKAFKIYGSMTLNEEDYFLVYETDNAPDKATITCDFEEATFRYYKLVITQLQRQFLIINEIEMWHTFELTGNGANQVAPFNYSLIYTGNWSTVSVQSSFGYAYLGKSGATIKFEMIGTRLVLLTNKAYQNKYEVWIDGAKMDSIDVKADDNEFAIDYISQKLSSGKHKVEIRCKGDFCLDSIAIFNES